MTSNAKVTNFFILFVKNVARPIFLKHPDKDSNTVMQQNCDHECRSHFSLTTFISYLYTTIALAFKPYKRGNLFASEAS